MQPFSFIQNVYLLFAIPVLYFHEYIPAGNITITEKATRVLRHQVINEANLATLQVPVTVTSAVSARSAGGKHDFFSEGDYWWPNHISPDSPYIQKDGLTNPDNFVAHRKALIRFSRIAGAMASAYKITGNEKYVRHAVVHYKAWFADTATMMHPQFLYAQAIYGRFTGRGIGIIDGIQLVEVAQSLMVMKDAAGMDKHVLLAAKQWFTALLTWLTTHRYGKDEMDALNNHGTCWVMQVAVFAKFTGDTALMKFCSDRYKNVLLSGQMASDGSFPLELKRTKPYGYSIFNLDAMATICQVLSAPGNDLWNYTTADGRSIKKGIGYLFPFVADKTIWSAKPDVMYWNEWPVAQPFLLFGANFFNTRKWYEVWKRLDHSPEADEVIRNLPVRHPLIWL